MLSYCYHTLAAYSNYSMIAMEYLNLVVVTYCPKVFNAEISEYSSKQWYSYGLYLVAL